MASRGLSEEGSNPHVRQIEAICAVCQPDGPVCRGRILAAMTCPACGMPSPSGARFCPSCGSVLARRSDERRLVTVVFADLVGYTTLSETRDPEAVKNLVDACFERLVADVVAFGGVVDKIIGDAIVALFGAPIAHEDDPERAVRAALRMQETLAEESRSLGVDLRMRIGINTGEVLVGTLRAGGDYTAMGDVVNTASRLQTLATPGQVLVGPGTHAATAGVRFEALGLLRAKGRDEPVPAWAALEVMGPPGARSRSLRAPLVGREHELGLLRHLLRTTSARRRAAAVLLVGEAGLGKSRLAEELVGIARAEGCLVLEGRCVPYGEVNVWAPLAEALRRASGVQPEDPPEAIEGKGRAAVAAILGLPESDPEVGRLLHGLSPLMGKPTQAGERSTHSRRAPARGEPDALGGADEEALWAMQTTVERLAARRPLLIVIGELHWADDLLLGFLDRLVDRISDRPVLLLATARPELLGRWQPSSVRNNRTVLHVDPLDDEAAGDMLNHLARLAGGGLTSEDREVLVARSGGNPLWLEELAVLSAKAAPAGPGRSDHLRHAPSSLAPLPATLRGLVAARLDLLEHPARSVLEDAAVCGRSGTVRTLEAMAEAAGRPAPDEPLDQLCAAGLLTMVHGRESWELRSELVREVAYGTLTKAERARRHARLATWLASRAGDDPRDDTLDDLAHHWSAAAGLLAELGGVEDLPVDTLQQAIAWVERAARRAIARELWLPASGLLDTVLRLTPPTDVGRVAAILLERATARVGLRDIEGAAADLGRVADAAETMGDDGLLARSLVVRGDLGRIAGQLGESESALRQALELSRRTGDERTTVAALRALGHTLLFAGDDAAAQVTAGEALEGSRRLGDRRLEAWALQTLAWIAFNQGDLDAATSRLGESADAFSEIGDAGGRGWALGLLAWVRFSCGDLEGAESLGRAVLAEVSLSGDAWPQAMIEALIANTRLWSGHPDEAVEHGERALTLLRPLSDPWPVAQALSVTGRARLASGDEQGGLSALDEAIRTGADIDDPHMAAFPRATAATAMALQLGDGAGALAVAPPPGAVRDLTGELQAALAVAHLLVGQADEAVRCLVPLLSGDGAGGPLHPLRPATACWVALVLAAVGRRSDASHVLDEAADGPCTYLDRAWTCVARAAVAEDLAERAAWLEQALAAVAPTGDRLSQTNVARAAAHLGPHPVLALAEVDPHPVWDGLWSTLSAATSPVGRA